MASVQERLKLKRAPSDIWSIREQLCLASSVLKSGDQNWMSVSRSLRPIADKDLTRPPDWFSQKSCAQQYAYLLENTDIPKRKKRESGETTSESIVRRLTQDRISELSKILAIQREEYHHLKNELSLLKNENISDEKLQKMWLSIEQDEKEQEQKNKTHIAWLSKCHQGKESQSTQTFNIQNVQKKMVDILKENQEVTEISTEEEEELRNKSGRSSLLTSLLKSPSPTTIQIQTPTQAASSPTIASLLCSSPKVPGPITMQNVSPQLHQLVSNTIHSLTQERPSAIAPTLSMLLEQPAAGTQKILQQQLQNVSNLINSKSLQSSLQVQNIVQTRSARLAQSNNSQISQVQQVISNSDLSNTEVSQIISNSIDEVMPKVIQMDKDEINEIIGDIEELIKEEITSSPQTESSSRTAEMMNNLNVQIPTDPLTERSEPRNIDEPVSLSNSPTSEISIEEIDSSTSNIAEIIGTAIGTVESKMNISNKLKENDEIKEVKFIVEDNKVIAESTTSQELIIKTEMINKVTKESQNENENNAEINILYHKEVINQLVENKKDNRNILDISDCNTVNCKKVNEQEFITNENKIKDKEHVTATQQQINTNSELINISSEEKNYSSELDEQNKQESCFENNLKEDKLFNNSQVQETNKFEENLSNKNIDNSRLSYESEIKSMQNNFKDINNISKETELVKECDILKQESNNVEKENKKDFKKTVEDSNLKDLEKKEAFKTIKQELDTVINCEFRDNILEKNIFVEANNEKVSKKERFEDTLKNEKMKENPNFKNNEIINQIKIELKREHNEDNEDEYKQEKEEIKKEVENDTIKKESIESLGSVEELDEEEPTLSKLSGGRVMKTYSKKQNTTVDSEPENETGGETADYRAWKKSIMLVYNRLATHKYASIFLRPITEDQAPGYHSIIFRPMDLWTIKKNIDNGTIRSTTHFQRDVMLMFQNAIMFNKYNTLVHKMTLEMQEECLQHMQVLVRVAGEASFRRETRTAASISNETADNILKRKWSHLSSNPHETESSRMKKRRKSEND